MASGGPSKTIERAGEPVSERKGREEEYVVDEISYAISEFHDSKSHSIDEIAIDDYTLPIGHASNLNP